MTSSNELQAFRHGKLRVNRGLITQPRPEQQGNVAPKLLPLGFAGFPFQGIPIDAGTELLLQPLNEQQTGLRSFLGKIARDQPAQ